MLVIFSESNCTGNHDDEFWVNGGFMPRQSHERAGVSSRVPPRYTNPSRTRALWPTETILVSHNGQTKLLRRASLR